MPEKITTTVAPAAFASARHGRTLPYMLMEMTRPWIFLCGFILCVIAESVPVWDTALQNLFYENGDWFVTQAFHDAHRSFFYSGPKKVVMFGWVAAAAGFAVAFLRSKKDASFTKWLCPCVLVAVSLSVIPLVINFLKYATGVPCPYELALYGGEYAPAGFLHSVFFEGGTGPGRCFPAAHCSGGFAFLSLYFLPVSQRMKNLLLYTGMTFGWFMATYQMLRGQHFLSHSLATLFFALFFVTAVARLLRLCGPQTQKTGKK